MPEACLVINVDTDPDPASVPQDDGSLLAKYRRMREILEAAGAPGAWCVLTGPICRTRFLEEPFVSFWRDLRSTGHSLVLHAEEDLYGPPPDKQGTACSYLNAPHMQTVIREAVGRMGAQGLAFDAWRGGYHGFTPQIGHMIRAAGIGIELSCGPGIEWPEKAAAWQRAPLSAYAMLPDDPQTPVPPDTACALLEIPFAWDGTGPRLSRPFVIGDSYMINEFSTLEANCRVWDAIVARAAGTRERHIVSMITHTFAMGQADIENRLIDTLAHVGRSGRFIDIRAVTA